MAARIEKTMAVVISAIQLAMKSHFRWLGDKLRVAEGSVGVLTKLFCLSFRATLPVWRSSHGVLLQVDDGAGYTLAFVTGKVERR